MLNTAFEIKFKVALCFKMELIRKIFEVQIRDSAMSYNRIVLIDFSRRDHYLEQYPFYTNLFLEACLIIGLCLIKVYIMPCI